jgi:DNA-binding transcriptional MerR regulator
MSTQLPDKIFYKIGEVAQAAGVRTSVLRFWESEFPFLKPVKSNSGQRLYSKNIVELVLHVRNLLYDQKYTIEGVKKQISPKGKLLQVSDTSTSASDADSSEMLKMVRNELLAIRSML